MSEWERERERVRVCIYEYVHTCVIVELSIQRNIYIYVIFSTIQLLQIMTSQEQDYLKSCLGSRAFSAQFNSPALFPSLLSSSLKAAPAASLALFISLLPLHFARRRANPVVEACHTILYCSYIWLMELCLKELGILYAHRDFAHIISSFYFARLSVCAEIIDRKTDTTTANYILPNPSKMLKQ